VNYNCGVSGLLANDAATYFLMFAQCDFTVTMTNVDPAGYDPVLLILNAYDGNACLAYADDNGPGQGETVTLTGMPPGYYYAVVDAAEGCGFWDLYLTVGNCQPTPTETPTALPTETPTILPTETAAPTATAFPCLHSGDVNGDETVTPGDAQLAFYYYLNCAGHHPEHGQYCAADFCGTGDIEPCDNSVTPADAQGIMRFYLGYAIPCGKQGGAEAMNAAPGAVSIAVAPEPAAGQFLADVTLAGSGPPVSAFGLEIRYDPELLTYKEALLGTLDPGWEMFGAREAVPGLVTIGAFSLNSVPSGSSGSLARLVFASRGDRGLSNAAPLEVHNLVDDLAGWAVRE